jgi:D-glucosaminate-6-phosphate ammonia-lyase
MMSLFARLGISTIINARGTASEIGTSRLSPAVQDAMHEAASSFVSMDFLQEKVGAVIAKFTQCEAAVVTPGAAAGITLSIASCIVGSDRYAMRQLPEKTGLKNEVVIQRGHRNDYDQAVLLAGGRFVEVGYIFKTEAFELESALSEKTCAVLFVDHMRGAQAGMVQLPEVIEIAHRHNVPVIVDASTKLPPVENLWQFSKMGVDLVIFSGGKAIQGPGASGFVCGKTSLIEPMKRMVAPHWGIGRPMKIGKEEIAGLLVALEEYVIKDHDAILKTWESRVAYVNEKVNSIAGYRVERMFPDECGRPIPRARITALDHPEMIARKVIHLMNEVECPIEVVKYLADIGVVMIDPTCLQEGEVEIVVKKLASCMEKAR